MAGDLSVNDRNRATPATGRTLPDVLVFNPFAEAIIAQGKRFHPVKPQIMLARDLASLPQFLARPNDCVLLEKAPSPPFLNSLRQAGFDPPEFVESSGQDLHQVIGLKHPVLRQLRPWAWSPESVELLRPLFPLLADQSVPVDQRFNPRIAQFYSKAWSTQLLENVLHEVGPQSWLSPPQTVGTAVDSFPAVQEKIRQIRANGHHRLVVKEAYGMAGHNMIRLWEPDLLPKQQLWIQSALAQGHPVIVEPWLDRILDFSVQLEMSNDILQPCGSTRLLNDFTGQFQANLASPAHHHTLPVPWQEFFPDHELVQDRATGLFESIRTALEKAFREAGYQGPAGIDALLYRTATGQARLKPIVEINPRYTMGRLTLELMAHAAPHRYTSFRLVNPPHLQSDGFTRFQDYAHHLANHLPVRLDKNGLIQDGAVCLNDPSQAQGYLAVFHVSPDPPAPLDEP